MICEPNFRKFKYSWNQNALSVNFSIIITYITRELIPSKQRPPILAKIFNSHKRQVKNDESIEYNISDTFYLKFIIFWIYIMYHKWKIARLPNMQLKSVILDFTLGGINSIPKYVYNKWAHSSRKVFIYISAWCTFENIFLIMPTFFSLSAYSVYHYDLYIYLSSLFKFNAPLTTCIRFAPLHSLKIQTSSTDDSIKKCAIEFTIIHIGKIIRATNWLIKPCHAQRVTISSFLFQVRFS